MKKQRIKVLLILFFMCLMLPININADVSCETIQDAVDKYNNIVTDLEGDTCDNTEDSELVIKCNDLRKEKSLVLSKLFKYNDISKCNNPELNRIIKENEENCSNVFGSTLKDLTKSVMGIFYLVAPFLLIIFGSIDFSKIVVMNDPKMIKTARTNFFKRLTAFVLLYMVPAFVSIVLNFNFSNYTLTGNVYSCKTDFVYQLDRWDVTYIPTVEETNNRSSSSNSDHIVTGGITTDEEMEKLNIELANMINTKIHGVKGSGINDYGMYQDGPFPPEFNAMEPFQCTWWAQGRASQYLKSINSKYDAYPHNGAYGNGGQWYQKNIDGGWFKYGQTPKPNSIVSWTQAGQPGHVAYVEGVSSDAIYISHAGGGVSWLGMKKLPLSGVIWSSYSLNGYIYLDEPN